MCPFELPIYPMNSPNETIVDTCIENKLLERRKSCVFLKPASIA
jgi:hypothetical protein